MMTYKEFNFDGLVGPTHFYAGLSFGNEASLKHQSQLSNPKQAAIQGLEKMWALHQMGCAQAVFPPVYRPSLEALSLLGFKGSYTEALKKCMQEEPYVFTSLFSASSMWMANSATLTPSIDTHDHKVHITPANLSNKFHRWLELKQMTSLLKNIFKEDKYFIHHDPLPNGHNFGDEGSANHTRLCRAYGDKGIHLFNYGRVAFDESAIKPIKYPARQTLEASKAIIRLHQIPVDQCVLAQNHPQSIDLGVFHNDVIAVGNQNFLFVHEYAFHHQKQVLERLRQAYSTLYPQIELKIHEVSNEHISVKEAVSSYLFNSQIIYSGEGQCVLIAPSDCLENNRITEYLNFCIKESSIPIDQVQFFNLRQSMKNGGGPACLRLRIVLNDLEATCVKRVTLDKKLYLQLKSWIHQFYRDRLGVNDLLDSQLISEIQTALDKLTDILKLGCIYPFQKGL